MGQNGTASDEPPKTTNPLMRWLPLVIIAGALAAFFALGWHKYFSIDVLRDNRQALTEWVAANRLMAVGLFMAAYAAAVAISFPGASILTVFGGFLFGMWVGVPAIVTAATVGALIIFLAAKTALGDGLTKKAGGFVKSMEQGFRDDELSYMFLLRLAPVFPFFAVNIAAGLIGVSTRNFLIGTFFGIIPGTAVYASIGNAAGAAFDAGEDVPLTGILTQPSTLFPIIGLIVLAIIPIVAKRFTKRLDTDEAA